MEFLILTLIAIIGPFVVDLVANHYHKLPTLYEKVNPWYNRGNTSELMKKRINYYEKALKIKEILDKIDIPKNKRIEVVEMLSELIQEINTNTLVDSKQRREVEQKIKTIVNELQKYSSISTIKVICS